MKSFFSTVSTEAQVKAVVMELELEGFTHQSISVLFSRQAISERLGHVRHAHSRKHFEGSAAGIPFGGALGLIGGVGSLSIPGTGMFLMAAGPVMASLSTAAFPAGKSIRKILMEMEIPKFEARFFEHEIKNGRFLFSIRVTNAVQEEIVRRIFREARSDYIFEKTREPGIRGPF